MMTKIFTKSPLLRIKVTTDKDTYRISVQERYLYFLWRGIYYEEIQIKDFWNPFGPVFDTPILGTVLSNYHGYFHHETWKPGTFDLDKRVKEIFERTEFSHLQSLEIRQEINDTLELYK